MLRAGLRATFSFDMVGRVGYDIFADHLKASLAAAGVDVSAVAAVRSEATGVALIGVDEAGQNAIIVAAGANGLFPPADVEGSRAELSRREVCAIPVGDSGQPRLRRRCALRDAKGPGPYSIQLLHNSYLASSCLRSISSLQMNRRRAFCWVGPSGA